MISLQTVTIKGDIQYTVLCYFKKKSKFLQFCFDQPKTEGLFTVGHTHLPLTCNEALHVWPTYSVRGSPEERLL